MGTIETCDIVIFGGAKAGKTLAMDQAAAGKRVAVVEEGMIGGSCINVACIPTKTLVRSAQLAGLARRAAEFGLIKKYPVSVDMGRVAAHTASVVATMVEDNRQRASGRGGLSLRASILTCAGSFGSMKSCRPPLQIFGRWVSRQSDVYPRIFG